ncbi:MAG: hypothetical protein P4L22_07095 [Candidatus Babeliales bacterium]|nr:hypothetical protein [Candidatus Babeliales bacterium]
MKKSFLILLLLSFCQLMQAAESKACNTSNENYCGSRTFFRPRSVIEDVSIFFSLNNYNNYRNYYGFHVNEADSERINISKGTFYEKSVSPRGNDDCNKNVGTYFLPENKPAISIIQNGANADVNSLWLNVEAPTGSTYSSVLSLNPERQIFGGYFSYFQEFECLKGSWLEVDFAVYEARHKLHAKEVRINNDVTGIVPGAATALQYLQGGTNQLQYGKFLCDRNNVNFDDIQVKFGHNWFNCNQSAHLGLYGQLLVPIAPKPTAKYLFEPLVGRAHWGLGAGLNGAYKFYETENHACVLMADASYQYLFKSNELRTFDLTPNGQWSRYLLATKPATTIDTFPLLNATTESVSVTPRGVVNFWAGLHFQKCDWHFEAGYNLWWRQAEKISLNNRGCGSTKGCTVSNVNGNVINGNIGIFALDNICTPLTASTATISDPTSAIVTDSTFIPVNISELNLASAAHPRTLTNKVYGSLAYDIRVYDRPLNMGITGSYEFSKDRNAFNQWGILLTFDVQC